MADIGARTPARPAPRRRSRTAGFTLVEAAVVVCLVGVVLAVFVPTFIRHLHTSKIAEAADELEAMQREAATYYAAPHRDDRGRMERQCLPPAAGPAPAEPSETPVAVDFAAPDTPGHATFRALGFQPIDPVRYRYRFEPAANGCGIDPSTGGDHLVTVRAEGDLDGDGKMSTFIRTARGTRDGRLVPSGVLYEVDRTE